MPFSPNPCDFKVGDLVEVFEGFSILSEKGREIELFKGFILRIRDIDENDGDFLINTKNLEWKKDIWINPIDVSCLQKIWDCDSDDDDDIFNEKMKLPQLCWTSNLKTHNEEGIYKRKLDDTPEEITKKFLFSSQEDLNHHKLKCNELKKNKYVPKFKPSPYTSDVELTKKRKKLNAISKLQKIVHPRRIVLPKFIKLSTAARRRRKEAHFDLESSSKSTPRFGKSVRGKEIKEELKFEKNYTSQSGFSDIVFQLKKLESLCGKEVQKKKEKKLAPLEINDRSFLSKPTLGQFDLKPAIGKKFLKQLHYMELHYHQKLLEININKLQ